MQETSDFCKSPLTAPNAFAKVFNRFFDCLLFKCTLDHTAVCVVRPFPASSPPGPTRIRKKKLNRQRAASRCSRAFRHLGFTNQTFKKKRNIQNLSRIDPKTNKDSTKNRSKFNPRSFQGWSNYQEKTSCIRVGSWGAQDRAFSMLFSIVIPRDAWNPPPNPSCLELTLFTQLPAARAKAIPRFPSSRARRVQSPPNPSCFELTLCTQLLARG